MPNRRKYVERFSLHLGGVGGLLLLVLLCRFQGDTGVYDDTLGALVKPVYRIYYMLHFVLDAASQRILGTHGLSEWVRMAICVGIAGGLWGLVCVAYLLARRFWSKLGSKRAAPVSGAPHEIRPVSRRVFFTEVGAGTSAMMACGAAYPVVVSPEAVHTVRHTLRIKDWPAALEGLRAVQLTDTHYGPMISLGYLNRVIAQTNALQPDIVLLTGDYVHNHRRHIPEGVRIFSGLRSKFGSVAVLGNHDHWVGLDITRTLFEEIGVPLIDNSRCFLTPQGFSDTPGPDAVCIAGVGDLWCDKVDFHAALGDLPEGMPRLLLSHNPDVAEMDNGHRVDAMFSGHTHGGQVCIPGLGPLAYSTDYGDKYLAGLCEGPWTTAIVSRGIGVVALPIRFNCPAELIEITFVRA